jgi:acetyl esterase/lipase
MKYIKLVFFFTCIYFSSCNAFSPKCGEENIAPEQIVDTTMEYGHVQLSNPIEIYETELGSAPVLSTISDFAITAVERAIDESLSIHMKLKATIYRPADTRQRPCIVLFHGGAFIMGYRRTEEMTNLAKRLAQKGFIVITGDYRMMNPLTPSFVKAGYCAAQDGKALLRYLNAHAQELHIDKDNFFVGGVSAGSCTALNTAFLDDNEEIIGRAEKFSDMYGALSESGNSYTEFPAIRGVINICGGVFSTEILDDNIPVISFQGDEDKVIAPGCDFPFQPMSSKYNALINRVASGLDLVFNNDAVRHHIREASMIEMCGAIEIDKSLKANNVPSELVLLPNEGHSFFFSDNGNFTRDGKMCFEKMLTFICKNKI